MEKPSIYRVRRALGWVDMSFHSKFKTKMKKKYKNQQRLWCQTASVLEPWCRFLVSRRWNSSELVLQRWMLALQHWLTGIPIRLARQRPIQQNSSVLGPWRRPEIPLSFRFYCFCPLNFFHCCFSIKLQHKIHPCNNPKKTRIPLC